MQKNKLKSGIQFSHYIDDGHIANGNMLLRAYWCEHNTLLTKYVIIIVQSHWLNLLFSDSTAISWLLCMIALFWSQNRIVQEISCDYFISANDSAKSLEAYGVLHYQTAR